ncbi:sodium-dependent transporter [Fusibacter sp. 3D3]|uniref:sodium-dependent transporter n=1 Tax=Fusibacter sp. 3D3 TaxID=1048380 RepID=UPI00085292E1|nr:sodium-dependent transporter [Fusibacter sp. 3D3]GAU79315.1 sodium-dependent transporter [Fusibacter sp. 3D3]
MENKNLQQRDGFSSKMGIIAAAAGSAIGLGNIWKFPYITGKYGGAAFILVYLLCIALIGLPVMLQEFTIGRRAQANAISSFKKLKPNTPWFLTGWLGFITAFVILSYYGVVAGWTLSYVFSAITNSFAGQNPEALGGMFGALVSSPWKPVLFQVIFMALTAGVILGGVKNGIEKYSKILMPLLLLIIIILDIRAVTLQGAGEGIAFLFQPDFGKLTAAGIMSALGHAFFSLSLGMGTMITYGSYIGKKENLGVTALQVTIADTAIALLAGLAIFPAVFAFGIEPGSGPGLVFITLPNVFNQMPGGYIFAIMFFVLLAVAALTSSISILEVVVAYFVEDKGWDRKKATIIATVAITALGAFESLTNGTINFTLPLLKAGAVTWFGFFDWMIELSDLLLPIGGFFISIFVGWIMSKKDVDDEITNSGELAHSWVGIFDFLTKWVAPILILITFINLIVGFTN